MFNGRENKTNSEQNPAQSCVYSCNDLPCNMYFLEHTAIHLTSKCCVLSIRLRLY